jgi:hypothetical protein
VDERRGEGAGRGGGGERREEQGEENKIKKIEEKERGEKLYKKDHNNMQGNTNMQSATETTKQMSETEGDGEHRQTDTQTNKQTNKQINKQKTRKTDRQNRQTVTEIPTHTTHEEIDARQ